MNYADIYESKPAGNLILTFKISKALMIYESPHTPAQEQTF